MAEIERPTITLPSDMAAIVREALKVDIDKGLADIAEGHVKDFDAARIIERGRKLLATPRIWP